MRIIAGRWRGHTIQAPPGRDTRPTTDRVREAWMSALEPVLPGARVLDLFAGSGALGLEALSRGASHVTFVERSGPAMRALAANIARLGADEETAMVRADVFSYIRRLAEREFDIALADPPYGRGIAERLVREFVARPFADWLWIEHSARDALPEPPGSRTRRYGDTLLTSIPAEP